MAAMLAITATLSAVETSTAGVFPVDTVTSKAAAPHDVVDVRHGGGAIFAGLALGLLGAAIVGSYYYGPRYYYYPGYAYSPYPYYYSSYPGYWGYRYPFYPRYRHYRFGRYW
jgi:hypothetical protein